MQKCSYLIINILCVLGPLMLSFDKKVSFYKKWKFVFPGLLLSGVLFLIWDLIFTVKGVWAFNSDYIIGVKLWGLPLEEMLFFISIPFACLFIYECLKVYFNTRFCIKNPSFISSILMGFCVAMLFFGYQKIYTLINFGTLLILLYIIEYQTIFSKMSQFYRAYIVCLVPFYIVNGILTWIPVVSYNDAENLNFRIGSIPFEDHFYFMSLFLINVYFYEYFQSKNERLS